VLIVVGDFATNEMFAEIDRNFGDWRAPQPDATQQPEPPRHHEGRRVHLVHLPGSVQTQVTVGNLAITRRSPDWHSTVLANAIYGGAFHSRLVMNIREQKGYTYSPRSGLNALRQHGYFSVSAAVRNDVAAATLTEIFYEMDRIRALPVTPEELDSARNYLTGVFSLGVATLDGLIGQLSAVYLERLPEGYLETYRERVRALTADNVIASARRHFDSATANRSANKPRSLAKSPTTTRKAKWSKYRPQRLPRLSQFIREGGSSRVQGPARIGIRIGPHLT
jgi:predicted Zn-dependent peptidase